LEHAGKPQQRLGLRPFARADIRHAVESAAEAAWSTDKGGPIAEALMVGLRDRRIALPSPDTLERVGLAGRARARRRAAEDLLARVSSEQLADVDKLLVDDPDLKMTPLAWLRDTPESPSAAGMAAITERLAYVRASGIDPAVAAAIHERRFDQYAREGAVAPVFWPSRLYVNGTMASSMISSRAGPNPVVSASTNRPCRVARPGGGSTGVRGASRRSTL
jgi:hypothetical protein